PRPPGDRPRRRQAAGRLTHRGKPGPPRVAGPAGGVDWWGRGGPAAAGAAVDRPAPAFPPDSLSVVPFERAAAPPPGPTAFWRGGDEISLGGRIHLLHDPVEAAVSADGSLLTQQAWARPVVRRARGGRGGAVANTPLVWLRQARMTRPTPSAAERLDALRRELALLAELGGAAGLPTPRVLHADDDGTGLTLTLVLDVAAGHPLDHLLGRALDRPGAARFVASLRPLCAQLDLLHRRRMAHRALSPAAVQLRDGANTCTLRDLGLAATAPRPGEGPAGHRAPEQEHPLRGGVGPATDLYQLGLIVYRALTGRYPARTSEPLPAGEWNPRLPAGVDRPLGIALRPDPARRELTVSRFQQALADAFAGSAARSGRAAR
ncbi:hypothetical protein MXD62_36410, partial [Frankia sp. Mgl5]|nr:hypothetical protein [Frankia sp. Mgl5]